MLENQDHQLLTYSMAEKKAYLLVVATLAAADNEVSDEEIVNLRKLCKRVDLDAATTGEVLAAAENPTNVPIKFLLQELAKSELRFTLITDMVMLAHADRVYSDEEKQVVAEIALELKINSEQLKAIENYVDAVVDYDKLGLSSKELKKYGGDVAAGLASAGVPIAAVAVSGTVWGLSAAGITSGLIALGLGLGMTGGLGVVAILGVASYFGVRWVYRQIVDDNN